MTRQIDAPRTAWNPDWVVAPGETLKEWREDYAHLPAGAAAKACGRMPLDLYQRVESGDAHITDEIAGALAHGTSIPAYLWLNLERAYRAGLAEGKKRL